MTECFPILSLEQVYAAIAYYLSNRRQVNACLRQVDEGFEAFQQITLDPDFSRKMTKARRELHLAAA